MKRKSVSLRCGYIYCAYAFGLTILLPAVASAATSFSNSLTGFTGNSTLPATQTAFGTAGFNFFSTTGLAEDFNSDPTVNFDATGATFGGGYSGDGGRNYVRTNDSDYANVSFTAQVTIVTSNLKSMDVFLGLGPGDIRDTSTGCCYGWPDWGTLGSAVMVLPEITDTDIPYLTTLATQNDVPVFANNAATGLGDGTHRVQLVYDATAKTAVFSIDTNYAGGAYTADITAPTIDTSLLYAADGWPTEASRIYFGGDDSAIFKDFSVVTAAAPVDDADFNNDGKVDGRDFLIWQRGYGTGTTNATGDANGSGNVNAADLAIWQNKYGVGGLTAITAVPEPASAVLLAVGIFCATSRRRS